LGQCIIGLHTIEEVLTLLSRHRHMFRRGGGCQLSGREVELLMQLLDLLRQQLQLLTGVVVLTKRDDGKHRFFGVDLDRQMVCSETRTTQAV
jgi:hypothetical protein